MRKKPFWKSKTLWANLVMGAVELFTGVGNVELTVVVNAVLRAVSDGKLTVDKVTVNRLSALVLAVLMFGAVACAFKAENVKHTDGDKETTIEQVGGSIDP